MLRRAAIAAACIAAGAGWRPRYRCSTWRAWIDSIAKSKRIELERLQKQLEDNRTVVNIRQVPIEAQIIGRAMASATPAYPRKGPSALLATAATLILGLALIVTRALMVPPAVEAPRTAGAPSLPVASLDVAPPASHRSLRQPKRPRSPQGRGSG